MNLSLPQFFGLISLLEFILFFFFFFERQRYTLSVSRTKHKRGGERGVHLPPRFRQPLYRDPCSPYPTARPMSRFVKRPGIITYITIRETRHSSVGPEAYRVHPRSGWFVYKNSVAILSFQRSCLTIRTSLKVPRDLFFSSLYNATK